MTAQAKSAISDKRPVPTKGRRSAKLRDVTGAQAQSVDSPVHAYQHALQAALSEAPEAKFPVAVRVGLVGGASLALWGAIIGVVVLLF